MGPSIACGHPLSARAALSVLRAGGNAFDGIGAACFASCATEPMLTSLAGGGIGLLRFPSGDIKCIDFLTNFPKAFGAVDPLRTVVSFGDETQIFFMGYGSLGVPGALAGLLHIHTRYGRLPLEQILAPAIDVARGHPLNRFQAYILRVLERFCLHSREAREVFAPRGRLLSEGDTIRNSKLAGFLETLAGDQAEALELYREALSRTLSEKESTLSLDDFDSYGVIEREPIRLAYRDHEIALAPPPAVGGILVAHALKLLENCDLGHLRHNSAKHIETLVGAMQDCDSRRTRHFFDRVLYEDGFWKVSLKSPDRLGGTTHVSIIDQEGNAAGITTSNGQGAGIMVRDTGIMLNNFAAEPDLMQYRDVYRPGERITSMMTPSMILRAAQLDAVLGSGGSNRIRSAILQAISNLVDFGMAAAEAVNRSRMHFESGVLQLEHGILPQVAQELSRKYRTNVWSDRNLFFGGVHLASPLAAAGDRRRGGAAINPAA
ncbi:MAG: gamma-glutamyltransferase [Acidobacteriota bacterium]